MAVAEGDTSQEETRGYEAISALGNTARVPCIALSGASQAVLQPLAGRRCSFPGTDILPPPQGPCAAPSLAKQLDSAGVQAQFNSLTRES